MVGWLDGYNLKCNSVKQVCCSRGKKKGLSPKKAPKCGVFAMSLRESIEKAWDPDSFESIHDLEAMIKAPLEEKSSGLPLGVSPPSWKESTAPWMVSRLEKKKKRWKMMKTYKSHAKKTTTPTPTQRFCFCCFFFLSFSQTQTHQLISWWPKVRPIHWKHSISA